RRRRSSRVRGRRRRSPPGAAPAAPRARPIPRRRSRTGPGRGRGRREERAAEPPFFLYRREETRLYTPLIGGRYRAPVCSPRLSRRLMLVQRTVRFALIVLAALLAAPVATAAAASRMPIGFYDDPSFRWSGADQVENLAAAQEAGSSIIHTTADWAEIAPTRPAHPLDPDDPAYRLSDLDGLVRNAARYGQQVMINISGAPKWSNGGLSRNHAPRDLGQLTQFAQMLASRYSGKNPGYGAVARWSVWNEPNLGLFLLPQFSGKRIVSPGIYARIYKAAYAGIKAGNPLAQVAIGETSNRGRDKPLGGVSDSVAPGTFARLLSQVKGLKFDGWAHHPYPTSPNLPPMQKVRYPNVTLSTMAKF